MSIDLAADTPLDKALAVIDESGVVERLQQWRVEDRSGSGPGGRPRIVGDRALLALWLALANESRPMLVTKMAATLAAADDALLERLGVAHSAIEPNWYSRCWRSLHAVLAVIDAHPIHAALGGDRRTLISKTDWANVLANRDPEDCARKQERLDWFTNALVDASVQMAPRDIRRRWEGNIAVDGTVFQAWGRRPVGAKSKWMHSEPDGGFYRRDGDHSDVSHNGGKIAWGYELTVATMVANEPGAADDFPLLSVGIAFDKPGHKPGRNAVTAISSVVAHGHPVGLALGDRAYLPGSKPENYQLPVAALGYGHVGDYRSDMAAITVAEQGAIQVDGSWLSMAKLKSPLVATRSPHLSV